MTHEQITTVEQVISDLETASSRNDVETLEARQAMGRTRTTDHPRKHPPIRADKERCHVSSRLREP